MRPKPIENLLSCGKLKCNYDFSKLLTYNFSSIRSKFMNKDFVDPPPPPLLRNNLNKKMK